MVKWYKEIEALENAIDSNTWGSSFNAKGARGYNNRTGKKGFSKNNNKTRNNKTRGANNVNNSTGNNKTRSASLGEIYRQSQASHYAQLVWKTTKKVGCFSEPSKYAVCVYSPRGNQGGKFAINTQAFPVFTNNSTECDGLFEI